MNITVVIPTLNGAATLPAQLFALDRQLAAPPFSVIVVDNGSTDDTARIAKDFAATQFSVQVIDEPVRGINSARNAGCAAAPDGAVLLCDADDEVHPGWLAAMTGALAEGCWVGGRLDYVSLNTPQVRLVWGAPDLSTYRQVEPFVDSTFGGNCGFWRSMWEQIGRFDSSISGTGGDETEFFMRAWGAGYRRVDVPAAVVAYRLRPGLKGVVRQRYRQGRTQVLVRALPGGALIRYPLSASGTRRAIAWRVLAAPKYLWRAGNRYAWLTSMALHLGRLAGFRATAGPATPSR